MFKDKSSHKEGFNFASLSTPYSSSVCHLCPDVMVVPRVWTGMDGGYSFLVCFPTFCSAFLYSFFFCKTSNTWPNSQFNATEAWRSTWSYTLMNYSVLFIIQSAAMVKPMFEKRAVFLLFPKKLELAATARLTIFIKGSCVSSSGQLELIAYVNIFIAASPAKNIICV